MYTALEVERLVNASGPTGGEVVLRDGSKPKTSASSTASARRDENTNRWCSRVCCMYSLKLAHLLKEHTDAEVFNFYIDMRTPGKGFEEFYQTAARTRACISSAGAWPRSPTGRSTPPRKTSSCCASRTRCSAWSAASRWTWSCSRWASSRSADADDVRRMFNISCASEGFFLERHPKLAPVNTFTDGIFLAGCCQGPKDIPDTVAQAGAAAAEALALIDAGLVETEPNTAYVVDEACSGCKTCVPLCPYGAITFDADGEPGAHSTKCCARAAGPAWPPARPASIRQHLFEDEEIFEEIEGVLAYV